MKEKLEKEKFSRKDIAEKLDEGFRDIKDELSGIIKSLDWKQISGYNDVELAIMDALSDLQFDSDIDLLNRAVTLNSRLTWFLNGLLGRNRLSVDIMAVTSKAAKVIKQFFVSYSLEKLQ